MTRNRYELPRCDWLTAGGPTGAVFCERPAIAVWCWGRDRFYVCEGHDDEAKVLNEMIEDEDVERELQC